MMEQYRFSPKMEDVPKEQRQPLEVAEHPKMKGQKVRDVYISVYNMRDI
jgi:hypothetical protein